MPGTVSRKPGSRTRERTAVRWLGRWPSRPWVAGAACCSFKRPGRFWSRVPASRRGGISGNARWSGSGGGPSRDQAVASVPRLGLLTCAAVLVTSQSLSSDCSSPWTLPVSEAGVALRTHLQPRPPSATGLGRESCLGPRGGRPFACLSPRARVILCCVRWEGTPPG